MRRRRRRCRRRGRRGKEEKKREEGECLGIASRAHAPRVRVCPRHPISTYCTHVARTCVRACVRVGTCEWTGGTYALRRSSNTRANRPGWRYRVSNGPNVRKSLVGAVSRVFLTESSRTRAAGNSIRCPCTSGHHRALSRLREANEQQSAGSSTYHTPALWEPFQRARQAGMTARGNARGVSSRPEEPRVAGSSSRTNSASPNMGRILRIPRGRALLFSDLSLLVDNFWIDLVWMRVAYIKATVRALSLPTASRISAGCN